MAGNQITLYNKNMKVLMKKNSIIIELILIMAISSGFFYYVAYQNEQINSINIQSYELNEEITFEIQSVLVDERDCLVISGYGYDLRNIEKFDNYVTGSGLNLYVNIQVILIDSKGNDFKLNTLTHYDDNLGSFGDINLRFYGFTAKVQQRELDPNETYTIGILSTSLNGTMTYKLSDAKVQHD